MTTGAHGITAERVGKRRGPSVAGWILLILALGLWVPLAVFFVRDSHENDPAPAPRAADELMSSHLNEGLRLVRQACGDGELAWELESVDIPVGSTGDVGTWHFVQVAPSAQDFTMRASASLESDLEVVMGYCTSDR